MAQRLKERYEALVKSGKFNPESGSPLSVHQTPKLVKIVVNRGLGDASQNARVLEKYINELSLITGQKAVVTTAKKAIATFKIREGMPVGICVTLRDERMFAFFDRLLGDSGL